MWIVLEHKFVLKLIKKNKVPKKIMEKYELWKSIVEYDGPDNLRKIIKLHDEALKGNWLGFRSSRLDIKWRVIYKVFQQEVFVCEITPHKY